MPVRPVIKNALKITLVLFWAFIFFLLVKKVHLAPTLSEIANTELKDSETWMSVYLKGQKIGYSVQSITQLKQGYIADSKTYLKLKIMNQVREVRTITSARLNKAMELKSFHFFLSSGPIRFQLTGVLSGLIMKTTMMTGGYRTTNQIRLNEAPKLATGLMPFLAQRGLKKNQRNRISIFDPSSLSSRWVNVVVEDQEKLIIEGESFDTFRVRMDYFDTKSYAWIDVNGQTIKEEGLLGLSMVLSTPEKAKQGLSGRAELTDVVRATSAPVNRVLEDPRKIRYCKVKLKGVDLKGFELDGGRQTLNGDVLEIRRETIDVRHEIKLPIADRKLAPFLQSTDFIQSRHPEMTHQARLITTGEKSPLETIDKVLDWTFKNLEKRPTMSVPSAVEVLKTKVGDCNEHAFLATALLRASGVPARVVVGVLYFEDRFYYHAWVEAYWGRWMAVDPVLGQTPADATHIRFMTGGLDRQAEMVRVIGRLKIDIIEAK
ncbi:MAG: transglutaminase domain-containing protein [Deltaproteobacteria bacterium]|nr:transglutaminase domain-containing protein [Deltaproteobacteria bacterium]MBW2051679.1 transglutaminase domain-containing protein [Deltaproteobacteria bacterium]MBW2140201.1 transglutaminase domain-containing protein [Deltaproteobacteria bacterium]MBW2323911.1 transglutaminase domain-containing protein [Deltaproteobacteria bacterium]